ncbi:TetR/AcrR family transcriptional regulator [bacterium]|nr:TetR/AcrR family transcriptional regulator [bacterium]
MPKATRSKQEVAKVREDILRCALTILEEDGFESCSMGKIGSRMKMTAANLYNYFSNKNQLFIGIHKNAFNRLYDQLSAAVKNEKTPLDMARGFFKAYIDFAIGNPALYDVMLNRPVLQHSDYLGTPEEKLSIDEFQSSMKCMILAIDVFTNLISSQPDFKETDIEFKIIETWGKFHGLISLYNSGTLKEISKEPKELFDRIIETTFNSYER